MGNDWSCLTFKSTYETYDSLSGSQALHGNPIHQDKNLSDSGFLINPCPVLRTLQFQSQSLIWLSSPWILDACLRSPLADSYIVIHPNLNGSFMMWSASYIKCHMLDALSYCVKSYVLVICESKLPWFSRSDCGIVSQSTRIHWKLLCLILKIHFNGRISPPRALYM